MSDISRDELDEAARKTVNYLYVIEDSSVDGKDIDPGLFEAIGRLRQLTNEEFVGKDKTISSQIIYDIISPAIQNYTAQKVQEARAEMSREVRKQIADMAAKHGQRADYFKPDVRVFQVSNLEWLATLPSQQDEEVLTLKESREPWKREAIGWEVSMTKTICYYCRKEYQAGDVISADVNHNQDPISFHTACKPKENN